MAAPARVHRRHELHTRREGDVRIGPRNADIAGLERLPKRIQNTALEFWQLVEEEDSEVSETDLARPDAEPAADKGGHGCTVMRRSERTSAHHLAAFELSSDRRDHRDFERLGRLKRRQDPGQAGREKRLPCAWRSAHQQIVSASRSDLECALGDFLALHLLEVRPTDRQLRFAGHRRREHRRPLEMREQRQQVGCGDDFDVPGPGSFGALSSRTDQPLVVRRSIAASSTPGEEAIRPSSLSSPTIT